ncbi:MAG TPA: hypothetical protein VN851_01265 [Thermoanaerobaculia bacterium]|nr:hypothetical protein [Thermoanaerobaculia bacterium]
MGLRRRATLLATSFLHGFTALFVPLASIAPAAGAILLLAAKQLFGDSAFAVYSIHKLTLRQTRAPEGVLGRVNAGMNLMSRGVLPIGALVGSFVAARIGIAATIAIGACGIMLATLWLAGPAVRRVAHT